MNDKIIEDWEDWEVEFVSPVLHVLNKEQIKQLEERKLVEEADNTLINEIFDNKSNSNSNSNSNIINSNNKGKTENTKNKPKISKQKENELKQKELSIKLKQKKEQEKNHAELYGEYIYDEYDKYDDKTF